MRDRGKYLFLCFVFLAACGKDAPSNPDQCQLDMVWSAGTDGHANPLGAGPNEARAGRVHTADLPMFYGDLLRWSDNDFVIANDKIAIVIEDAGPSDMYDPWGGHPVGIALVRDGKLFEPANMGEILLLIGRQSIMTTSVSVINDGSDGKAAVIRASGTPEPTPFFENIVGGFFRETHEDMPTAIDYVLEPGADYIDVYMRFKSARPQPTDVFTVLHGFMATPRTPMWAPGYGFDTEGKRFPYLAFVNDKGASYAYEYPDGELTPGVNQSGFASNFAGEFTIDACAETSHHHARITIGGPGLDGLLEAVARSKGETLRAITGTVRDAEGNGAAGVRIHVQDTDGGHLTRTLTDDNGNYTVHVPPNKTVRLTAYRRGDEVVGPVEVSPSQSTAAIDLKPTGLISVTATEFGSGRAMPVRVQVLPANDTVLPSIPGNFGEPRTVSGRLHVAFPTDGKVTLRAPVGQWEVIVSRGYEYEIYRETVTVTAGQTTNVAAEIEHVVDTTGVMCGDFHIHTHRSADSGDDAGLKVRSAAADGVEIPVRTDHEFVNDFSKQIAENNLGDWVAAIASVEMTSMEVWGHMGIIPLQPDPTKVNNGAPLWQDYPSMAKPGVKLKTLEPPMVFDKVRLRPEQPAVIIFHPRGGKNYFDYAGYNPETGLATKPDRWDDGFTLVEVFNDASWPTNLSGVVGDWLSLLGIGRRVFAVGDSDSHGISRSPVGYPRTCLRLGTDDPHDVTGPLVRDTLKAGKMSVSGGIYVDANVGGVQSGGDVSGITTSATVHIRVQAASWVDVDKVDIVVDGAVVDSIAIMPGDADANNPTIRFEKDVDINVFPGSYVIVASYGDSDLNPVHPGRRPFGVTNPIFFDE